ncbi:MAG: aldehyde reductase [Deltaproteobacteria bacterium]|nr:aldehyde reductase [Deltaproteobacteria bacterium]
MTTRRVLVTGAAGYLGTEIVAQLLERGYRVRGSVRDPNDPSKTAHLRELAAEHPEQLELVRADLLQAGAFAEPIKDCDYVIHTASSVMLSAKDPQREIVDVAVRGTENVMQAACAQPSVRRVVMTSSIVAVVNFRLSEAHRHTEADWAEDAKLQVDPYALSKFLAERTAWRYYEQQGETKRFELVTICPSFVIGPVRARVHLRSSPSLVRDLLRRKIPGCPQLFFNVVDIRDVARAHLEALERSQANGRYIVSAHEHWLQEIALQMAALFPQRKIPTRRLPNLLLMVAALFDKRANFALVRRNASRKMLLNNGRGRADLGIDYRPLDQSLKDCCDSMIEQGFV